MDCIKLKDLYDNNIILGIHESTSTLEVIKSAYIARDRIIANLLKQKLLESDGE